MTTASKAKGDNFERLCLDYLRSKFGQHLVRPRAGAEKDRGDISGLPGPTVIECKNYRDLATGIREGLKDLEAEQANAGARWGLVIAKRARTTDPAKQLVVMTLDQAVDLLIEATGHRHHLERADL